MPSHYRDLVTTTLTQRSKSITNSKTTSHLCLLIRQHHLGRIPVKKNIQLNLRKLWDLTSSLREMQGIKE